MFPGDLQILPSQLWDVTSPAGSESAWGRGGVCVCGGGQMGSNESESNGMYLVQLIIGVIIVRSPNHLSWFLVIHRSSGCVFGGSLRLPGSSPCHGEQSHQPSLWAHGLIFFFQHHANGFISWTHQETVSNLVQMEIIRGAQTFCGVVNRYFIDPRRGTFSHKSRHELAPKQWSQGLASRNGMCSSAPNVFFQLFSITTSAQCSRRVQGDALVFFTLLTVSDGRDSLSQRRKSHADKQS